MKTKGIDLEKQIEYGSQEAVIQNLKDAGCSRKRIEHCMALMRQGKKNELMENLMEQRQILLRQVHEEERRISCLDYLMFQIERQKTEQQGGSSQAAHQ